MHGLTGGRWPSGHPDGDGRETRGPASSTRPAYRTASGLPHNRGCRPTKALRASARVAHLARTAGRHGVRTGEVTVDFAAAMARKDALINGWVNSEAESLGHTDGLTLLYGEARFIGRSGADFELDVGARSLRRRRCSSTSEPARRSPRSRVWTMSPGSTTTASSTCNSSRRTWSSSVAATSASSSGSSSVVSGAR